MLLTDQQTLINKLGLHARAAAVLAKTAARFGCDIKVGHSGKLVDAKSVMALMLLAATCGTALDIEVHGEDAEDALRAIRDTILNRFGEDE